MKFFYRKKLKNKSFNPVVECGAHGHKKNTDTGLKDISFGILKLSYDGRYHNLHHNEECCIVLLNGTCDIKVNHSLFKSVGPRKNVFDQKAYAVYIPPSHKYEICAKSRELEVAVCRAYTTKKTESRAQLVTPDMVKERVVGKDNWERKVYDIIDKDVPAEKLLIGETINPPGNWSSFPPHKHDYDNIPVESENEEIYFFRVCPSNGFGIQRVYTGDRSIEQSWVVENNDLVVITKGYHPVVAASGHKLYYLWVLAGEKRILIPYDDPQYAWIKEG
jgi:5-deoxy-glucuronate isomerase